MILRRSLRSGFVDGVVRVGRETVPHFRPHGEGPGAGAPKNLSGAGPTPPQEQAPKCAVPRSRFRREIPGTTQATRTKLTPAAARSDLST